MGFELNGPKYQEWSEKRLEIMAQMERFEKIMDELAIQATAITEAWSELNRQLEEVGLHD
jgi:hypothetical protein